MRITAKSHFAKAIVRRNGQRCFILGRTFKVQTILEKQLWKHIRVALCKNKRVRRTHLLHRRGKLAQYR